MELDMQDNKALHAEQMARKAAYVNDLHTASAFWALSRNGEVFLKEYADCDCDDKGDYHPEAHLNRIKDWPGKFAMNDAGQWEAAEPFEPFTLHAKPETLSHQSLPEAEYKIEPGMKALWGHRVKTNRVSGGDEHEDTMIVGRVLPTGEEEVSSIYPDGQKFEHESYVDALGHSK